MKNNTVKVSDIKNYFKLGGSKKAISEYIGFTTERSIEQWIRRRRIPRFQQKRIAEYLAAWEVTREKAQ